MDHSDAEAWDALQRVIDPTERLMWAGKPARGLWRKVPLTFTIRPLFGLIMTIYGCYFAYLEIARGESISPAILLSTFMIAYGLFMIVSNIWLELSYRTKIFYGVTDRRVIYMTSLIGKQIAAKDIRALPNLSYKQDRKGIGGVYSRREPYTKAKFKFSWLGNWFSQTPILDDIKNPKEVYALITEAQRKSKRDSQPN